VAYAVVIVSVLLSICPSVTHRHCTKANKRKIMRTTPYDRPEFSDAKNLGKVQTGSPQWGR